MATQSWLQHEVAASARAELHRRRAAAKGQRDPDATLN
jgi:hypothetical protein